MLLAAAIVACTSGAAAAGADAKAKKPHKPSNNRTLAIRVEADKQGRTVPPSFPGLSIETPDLPDYSGTAAAPNLPFINLMRTLGGFGNGAPSIRIGGHSTDQSWWNPAGARRPPGTLYDVGPTWLAGLNAVVTRVLTPVVLGLNLGLNDPANARAFAIAAIETLPGNAIETFEIGNEPDLFAKPRTFHVGRYMQRRERHRPSNWNFNAYVRDLDRYLAALTGLGKPFAAGGFAGREFSSKTGELLGRTKGRIQELSVHSYALQTCGHGRKRPASELITRLLNARGSQLRIGRLASVARKHGVATRVSESNTAVCGGVGRVSNAFASALWGTDALFGFLKAGVTGVNFHTWTGAWYAPVEFRMQKGHRVAFVRPLFYGMLLFAKATANRARLVRVHWRGHHAVRVWATREANGKLHVVALNVSPKVKRKVRVRIQGASGPGAIERLTASSLGARHGIRLGGRGYGRQTASGELRGKLSKASASRADGVYSFSLPAASGAMLTVGR